MTEDFGGKAVRAKHLLKATKYGREINRSQFLKQFAGFDALAKMRELPSLALDE